MASHSRLTTTPSMSHHTTSIPPFNLHLLTTSSSSLALLLLLSFPLLVLSDACPSSCIVIGHLSGILDSAPSASSARDCASKCHASAFYNFDSTWHHCACFSSCTSFSHSTKNSLSGKITKCSNIALNRLGAHGRLLQSDVRKGTSFCLTTDKHIQINAVIKSADPKRAFIREVAILWKDKHGRRHTFNMVARNGKEQERGNGFMSSATLDGMSFTIPSLMGVATARADLSLAFEGTSQDARMPFIEVANYNIKIGDDLDLSFDMRVAPPMEQSVDEAEAHFNLRFNKLHVSKEVHGVLGQKYRLGTGGAKDRVNFKQIARVLGNPEVADSEINQNFLEGSLEDYITPFAASPKCKYSAF